MTLQISESGVLFGDFEEDKVFQIESSKAVAELGEGISKVEFVLVQDEKILFLEAKSSMPRDTTEFFEEIKQKMLHSLVVWFASVAGRHKAIKNELVASLQGAYTLKKPISLILVVPKMPSAYCSPATDKFRKLLTIERKLWNIKDTDIRVVNTAQANKMGLVSPSHIENER